MVWSIVVSYSLKTSRYYKRHLKRHCRIKHLSLSVTSNLSIDFFTCVTGRSFERRYLLGENRRSDGDVDVNVAANDEGRRVADGARNDTGRVKDGGAPGANLSMGRTDL